MSSAQNLELDTAQAAFKLTYAAGSQGWVITGAGGAGSSTSSSYSLTSSFALTASALLPGSVGTTELADDNVTYDKLSARFTAEVAISTLTGTVNYDCATASSFKLSGDLTGAYTINLTNYKKGQVITIYPLKAQTIKLTAGTGTEVFNKLSEMDYDNTVTNILQIECVDDQATDPVFFYSVATFALTPVGSTI
jgi:hypothetical protein